MRVIKKLVSRSFIFVEIYLQKKLNISHSQIFQFLDTMLIPQLTPDQSANFEFFHFEKNVPLYQINRLVMSFLQKKSMKLSG